MPLEVPEAPALAAETLPREDLEVVDLVARLIVADLVADHPASVDPVHPREDLEEVVV